MHILSHIHLEYDLLLHISIPHRYKSVYDELKNVTCQEDKISCIPRPRAPGK
jgi:hypothetical protein